MRAFTGVLARFPYPPFCRTLPTAHTLIATVFPLSGDVPRQGMAAEHPWNFAHSIHRSSPIDRADWWSGTATNFITRNAATLKASLPSFFTAGQEVE